MKIAVLGGGHGSYAAAADMADRGHRVRLWRRDAAKLSAIEQQGGLMLRDHQGTRMVALDLASGDIGPVLRDAELIVMPTPATAQAGIAEAMAGHLSDGQVIFMPPGTFGSYLVARRLREAGDRSDIALAEAGTLPYLTRKQDETNLTIVTRATRLPSGVFPARLSDHAFAVIGQAYPAVERLSDGLDGALMNAGPIIHPPLIMMNAGPIQHFDHWDIHNEGTQPAIRAVTSALDAERIAVREALGYGAPHFPLADHYSPDGEEWMYGNAAHERLVDSDRWREHLDLLSHRYMREDVACGLAFLVSVADYAGVVVPVAHGLLSLASAVVGEDLRRTGRTFESTELAYQSPIALRARLTEGFGP